MEGMGGHDCKGQLGSRKGTGDLGETETRRCVVWWRLEDKGKWCFPEQDARKSRDSPKCCWRSKRERKQTYRMSLRKWVAE